MTRTTCIRRILPIVAVLSLPLYTCSCWRSVLFHPMPRDEEKIAAVLAQAPWQAASLKVAEEITLSGYLLPPKNDAGSWLLFFGGNGNTIHHNMQLALLNRPDESWGVSVWSYRGYDSTDGDPSEDALVTDAKAIAKHLQTSWGMVPSRSAVVGFSLGTGVAVQLCTFMEKSGEGPAALVLFAPYVSLAEVVDDKMPLLPVAWSVSDSFDSLDYLKEGKTPILAIHGLGDDVISITHSRRLKEALGERMLLVEVNRQHNNLWVRPSPAVEPVLDFLNNKVPKAPGPQDDSQPSSP